MSTIWLWLGTILIIDFELRTRDPTPIRYHRAWLLAMPLGLALTALLAACGLAAAGSASDAAAPPERRLHIVVTTTILGDVVQNIVGQRAAVEVLLPIGADPHDFRPSAQQVAALETADLVVANGLRLEAGLIDVLESAAADGANVLKVAAQLDPIPFSTAVDGSMDPHVWLDPNRMAAAARLIADELNAIDPTVDWETRVEAYAAALLAADEDIRAALAVIPPQDRKLVTNHDALGYFAERYGFEVIGTVVPGAATLADPSSAQLAALVEVIRAANVGVIFAETTEPMALADAVAREVGDAIRVVELYTGSLGEPGSGAESLIVMLRTNAKRIAAGLGPGG